MALPFVFLLSSWPGCHLAWKGKTYLTFAAGSGQEVWQYEFLDDGSECYLVIKVEVPEALNGFIVVTQTGETASYAA